MNEKSSINDFHIKKENINSNQILTSKLKSKENSRAKLVLSENVSSHVFPKKTFFHSITGNIMNDSSDDSELDEKPTDILKLQKEIIDEYTDVNLKDKKFFNMWAEFMFFKYR